MLGTKSQFHSYEEVLSFAAHSTEEFCVGLQKTEITCEASILVGDVNP